MVTYTNLPGGIIDNTCLCLGVVGGLSCSTQLTLTVCAYAEAPVDDFHFTADPSVAPIDFEDLKTRMNPF